MGFTVVGPDHFLGSGHPDVRDKQLYDLQRRPLLGLVESRDADRNWQPLSLLGEADFHALRVAHGLVYGYDATRQRFMVSADADARSCGPPSSWSDLRSAPLTRSCWWPRRANPAAQRRRRSELAVAAGAGAAGPGLGLVDASQAVSPRCGRILRGSARRCSFPSRSPAGQPSQQSTNLTRTRGPTTAVLRPSTVSSRSRSLVAPGSLGQVPFEGSTR
jgi:hypothetical protein